MLGTKLHPCSAILYLRRNTKRALPIVVIMVLAVMGVGLAFNVLNSLIETERTNFESLDKVTILVPHDIQGLSGHATNEVTSSQYVEASYPVKLLSLNLKALVGTTSFSLWAVPESSFTPTMNAINTHLTAGRLPTVGQAEFVVSDAVAKAKGLKIGDSIGRSVNSGDGIPGSLRLVGLLDGGSRVALASYEYVSTNQDFATNQEALLVIPKEGQKGLMDLSLSSLLGADNVTLQNYNYLNNKLRDSTENMYLILGLVQVLMVGIMALSVALPKASYAPGVRSR